jgi:ABC-type multidrug transport system fused ATPase/permease subunit
VDRIVPGDILRVRAGDIIPADALILDSTAFTAGEAALTGEPYPVEKSPSKVATTAPSDTSHTLFRGAVAQTGEAIALGEKISVRHLSFYYQDGNHALKDVSVPIYANRVTAFIGPSGCGKSTLLRIFNRIYSLYPAQRVEGEVLLDGEEFSPRTKTSPS